MMTSLCRVQTTRCLGPIVDDRLAANCLIFSDVKEMRDGFSQRLIIPMNSVTIPIWPRASDRSGRRSWWCSWKLELIDRGKEASASYKWAAMPAMQVAHFAYHLEKKACIRRRSVKSRDWIGMSWTQAGRSEGASVNIARGKWSPLTTCLRITETHCESALTIPSLC